MGLKVPLRAVPPPLPSHLKSVPPLPPSLPPMVPLAPPLEPPLPALVDEGARTIAFPRQQPLQPFEDPTVLDDRPGALLTGSTMVRLFGGGRALVVRLVERMRVMQQMRAAVALERRAPLVPRRFDAATVNKVVVSTYKLIGFAVLTADRAGAGLLPRRQRLLLVLDQLDRADGDRADRRPRAGAVDAAAAADVARATRSPPISPTPSASPACRRSSSTTPRRRSPTSSPIARASWRG